MFEECCNTALYVSCSWAVGLSSGSFCQGVRSFSNKFSFRTKCKGQHRPPAIPSSRQGERPSDQTKQDPQVQVQSWGTLWATGSLQSLRFRDEGCPMYSSLRVGCDTCSHDSAKRVGLYQLLVLYNSHAQLTTNRKLDEWYSSRSNQ